jgi:hypothetical protein
VTTGVSERYGAVLFPRKSLLAGTEATVSKLLPVYPVCTSDDDQDDPGTGGLLLRRGDVSTVAPKVATPHLP